MSRIDRPREQALTVLCRAEDGVPADTLLEKARASFPPLDVAFIRELVYGTLRNRERLDWALDRFSERPVAGTDVRTRNILRLGAYQLLFLDRVPPRAAVDTSTELSKRHGRKPAYVNGLLRTLDRKRDAIAWPEGGDPVLMLSVLHSHPRWLVRRWLDRFGEERTGELLAANNRQAPLVIRTNRLRTTREELKASLQGDGTGAQETAVAPQGLTIAPPPSGLEGLAAFRQGWFTVQDEAAQLVVLLLAPEPGERVLDACAAPGGKTTYIAELMGDQGKVTALEPEPVRIRRIEENCRRLGLRCVTPVQGDAASYGTGGFDRILVDAPCSGLGVLRRHPDGRWIKSESSLMERQDLQQRILKNCAGLLRPGGTLVYATCSTEPEENEEVVAHFLETSFSQFSVENPAPHLPAAAIELVDSRGFFRTFPSAPHMDGFFAVRLRKKAR